MAAYRKTIIPALCLGTALVLTGTAQAAESGFYVGGSIGQATLKVPSDVTDRVALPMTPPKSVYPLPV